MKNNSSRRKNSEEITLNQGEENENKKKNKSLSIEKLVRFLFLQKETQL